MNQSGVPIDVRVVPKPQRHPLIFARFADLGVGEALEIVSNHEPKHLHEEFERDYPDCFVWTASAGSDREWTITITKTASTAPPRLLADAFALAESSEHANDNGALWRLETRDRQLDSNLVAIAPNEKIEAHMGPDLDVLILVVSGTGRLVGETTTVDLRPGALVWLPRLAQREFSADAAGLRYLTVHTKRPMLSIAMPT